MLGWNPAQRRIKSHLSDRNSHPARALVAKPKNALSIAHHNAAHLVKPRICKDLVDPLAVRIADEQPSRPPPDLREPLTPLADGWRIDNRQQLLSVTLDHRIKQRLVVVLKIPQIAVFSESRLARIQYALSALALILQRADMGRQQTM